MAKNSGDRTDRDPMNIVENFVVLKGQFVGDSFGAGLEMTDEVTGKKTTVQLPTENTLVITSFKAKQMDPAEALKLFGVAPPTERREAELACVEFHSEFASLPPLSMYQANMNWGRELVNYRGLFHEINDCLRHWPVDSDMKTLKATREFYLQGKYRQMVAELFG